MIYFSSVSLKENLVSTQFLMPLVYAYLLGQSKAFQILILVIAQSSVPLRQVLPEDMLVSLSECSFLYLTLINRNNSSFAYNPNVVYLI
jgi:hypothetical protein